MIKIKSYSCDNYLDKQRIPDEYIGNRIKALIVLFKPELTSQVDLKKYCAERMPRYMIPEEIEFCEILPKTSTGKIDRKVLIHKTKANR
jgi:acyl-CoA synthetase (AMP-forming)/AMP-acid ligase II